jgi:hypothetical protein
MALKRKKAYEEQINKIAGSRLTLETQVMAIENANVNLETMNAMAAGAAAMKSIHGKLYVFLFFISCAGISIKWTLQWMIFEIKWI